MASAVLGSGSPEASGVPGSSGPEPSGVPGSSSYAASADLENRVLLFPESSENVGSQDSDSFSGLDMTCLTLPTSDIRPHLADFGHRSEESSSSLIRSWTNLLSIRPPKNMSLQCLKYRGFLAEETYAYLGVTFKCTLVRMKTKPKSTDIHNHFTYAFLVST